MKELFICASCLKCHHGRVRVLVVEDDAALGQILVRGLSEEGYATDLAVSTRTASDALAFNEYDLVILDLGLPDGDGVSLCRSLRSQDFSAPILMLTARDGMNDKVNGLDAGADDYLTKPFDFRELGARVRALLRRPSETAGAVLEASSIQLDPAAHTVVRGDIMVPLTAREFSLLEYLMRRPGVVLTRTELLEHVWDANYDGLSNVVDVHIANLRRKLEVPTLDDPIRTVRGVGYQLVA